MVAGVLAVFVAGDNLNPGWNVDIPRQYPVDAIVAGDRALKIVEGGDDFAALFLCGVLGVRQPAFSREGFIGFVRAPFCVEIARDDERKFWLELFDAGQ